MCFSCYLTRFALTHQRIFVSAFHILLFLKCGLLSSHTFGLLSHLVYSLSIPVLFDIAILFSHEYLISCEPFFWHCWKWVNWKKSLFKHCIVSKVFPLLFCSWHHLLCWLTSNEAFPFYGMHLFSLFVIIAKWFSAIEFHVGLNLTDKMACRFQGLAICLCLQEKMRA